MNKRTTVFFALLISVTGALFALELSQVASTREIASEYIPLALVLAAIGIFSEMLSIEYKIGKTGAASTIAFIPLLAAGILLPRPISLTVALSLYGVSELILHKRKLIKGAFNISQVSFSLYLGTHVYESLGGIPGLADGVTVLSFAGLAVTFFFTNQILVSIAFASIENARFTSTFARIISSSGSNLVYDVLVSPISIVLVVLYKQWGVEGILVVILPLLIIRHSYMSLQRLQAANRDLLRVLVKTIETRDPYTSGHSVRVARLAKMIAEDMDLSPSKVDDIETAALVHDIGKIDSVYSEIIQKDAALTEAERKLIVTHAARGAEFLKTLSTTKEEVIRGVRHHHERYDGTGYPDGLKGPDIPLPARIIMLCDSIDAMLSDRPYRSALPVDKVRAELVRCSGSQFDPQIVQRILRAGTLERATEMIPAKEESLHEEPSLERIAV